MKVSKEVKNLRRLRRRSKPGEGAWNLAFLQGHPSLKNHLGDS
jgi:hypothetical protein